MSLDKTNFSNTQTRSKIIESAQSWIGVPWRHQGRNRRAIDCAGLIIMVGKEIGYLPESFDKTNYGRRSHGPQFLNVFRECLIEKKNNLLVPGDIIVMREDIYPCHSGIIGYKHDRPTIIHAHAEHRKVIEEDLEQSDRRKIIVATFEYPGTEEWPS